MTRKILLLALTLLVIPAHARASTWYIKTGANPTTSAPATSCALADLATAINFGSVTNGDTVVVGTGTCTWGSQLTNGGKAITISGSGTPPSHPNKGAATSLNTVINVNAGDNNTPAIVLTEHSAGSVKITNFTFNICPVGIATTRPFGVIAVEPISAGPVTITRGQPTRIYNNTLFWDVNNCEAVMGDRTGSSIHNHTSAGLVDHNLFTSTQPAPALYLNPISAIRCKLAQDDPANALWRTAPTYGANDTTGTNQVYFETNDVTYYAEASDNDDGCRMVLRHNTFTNSQLNAHAYDSSHVGARHWEVHDNNFVCAAVRGNQFTWLSIRGGTVIITDNTFAAFQGGDNCNYVNGGNGYDSYATLQKLYRSDVGCWNPAFGYPVTHQPGWGYGASGNAQTGESPCHLGTLVCDQKIEPTYTFNNTSSTAAPNSVPGVDIGGNTCNLGFSSPDYFQQNREWCNNNPSLGCGSSAGFTYIKYRYPHQLTGLTCENDCSGAPPSTSPVSLSGSVKLKGGVRIR